MKNTKIIEAMQRYGGSFSRSIGNALMYADEINYKRLVKAFPDLIEQYKEFAISEEKQETKVEYCNPS
jgi:hypothetical protein